MALTKAQVRTLVREAIDDPNGDRWTNANLDLLTQITFDDLFTDILTWGPYFTSQLDTITTLGTPGFVDLRQTATGDLSQRFFRIQKVTRNDQEYSALDARSFVIENNTQIRGPDFTYVIFGDQLWLFPLDTDDDVEVRYSFRPAAYDGLADATEVTWPDGHETALIYEVGARALTKGDAEDRRQLGEIAERSRTRMKAYLSRRYAGPIGTYATDRPVEWGSV